MLRDNFTLLTKSSARTAVLRCSGAEVEQYYLASKAESGVQPDPKGIIQVMKAEATKLPDGSLQALFTVRLPDFAVTKNYICDSM